MGISTHPFEGSGRQFFVQAFYVFRRGDGGGGSFCCSGAGCVRAIFLLLEKCLGSLSGFRSTCRCFSESESMESKFEKVWCSC